MYCTVKVDMSEDLIYELSQFMPVVMMNISQCIQSRGDKYEAGKSPLYFSIYSQMFNIIY